MGAKLFHLPPYSPDLNPIEQVFAKLKDWLRQAAERSRDSLRRRIDTILDLFNPDECANYFDNTEYASAETSVRISPTIARRVVFSDG